MFSFNLVDESWLPCLMNDGSLSEVSLREVLGDAAEIRELLGDSPPETIALHRFLLAILHRALRAPQTAEEWGQFWAEKAWDKDGRLSAYLEKWKHRFDLFDESRPFYQVSSLEGKVQEGAIIQLYFQGKNNATLFEHSTLLVPSAVSPSEAARLLIAFQGFDVGGLKADGSAKTAPLLQSAVALIKGNTLFETLMLNWHVYDEQSERPFEFRFEDDLPPWERASETEATERVPDGYVDLLTWQARRVLLRPGSTSVGEDEIRDAVIMKGCQFPGDFQRPSRETMIGFRRSQTAGFFPLGFSQEKALWRNSLTILQTVEEEQYRPGTLDWLYELTYEGRVKGTLVFPVDFLGLAADKAKLLSWHQERFLIPVEILNDNSLLSDLRLSISFAEEVGQVLRRALKEAAEELETDLNGLPGMSAYWSGLEPRFKLLLVEITRNRERAMKDWFSFADRLARESLTLTLNSLGSSGEEHKAAILAEKSFFGGRKKVVSETSEFAVQLAR